VVKNLWHCRSFANPPGLEQSHLCNRNADRLQLDRLQSSVDNGPPKSPGPTVSYRVCRVL
jgi:hypothetical protein